jgi:DNA mismatch repair ATPase MutS
MTSKTRPKDASSFKVDQGTISDLQLDSLILRALFQSLHSPQAQAQLREIVTQPLLDVSEIRLRYAAIARLSEDPALPEIEQQIGKFEKCLNKFGRLGPELNISDTLASITRGSVFTVALRILIGILLVLGPRPLALFILLYTFTIYADEMKLSLQLRRQLIWIKDVMRAVGYFADRLSGSESPLLRDYGETLKQSSLYPDSDDFRQLTLILPPSFWTRALDLCTCYSRFSLFQPSERVLDRLNADFELVQRIIADIDILQANVRLMREGYTEATLLEDGPPRLRIQQGHHPFLFQTDRGSSVANDVHLEISPSSACRLAVITGPNAGGKSTYLRMVASNILLALSGNLVATKSMELTPMVVITNMRAADSVEHSESFFVAQAKRIRNLDEATMSHAPCLVIFDEIGTGTSSLEKQALERTVIERLLQRETACLVATHERSLTEIAEATEGMVNLRVESRSIDQYRVVPGISPSSEAGRVLEEVGLPDEFLERYKFQLANIQKEG